MAVTITSNKKNTAATIHVASANASLVIAGNSSVSSIATGDEVLTGAYITQVFFGHDGSSADGGVAIYRGANLVAAYDTTCFMDYAGTGMALTVDQEATLEIKFIGSNASYCMLEVQKVGKLTANSVYFQN